MPTNLYGPGDNYHPQNSHVMASLISKFCKAARNSSPEVTCWGTGKPMREFLHVDDLGDAAVFCLEQWNTDLDIKKLDSNNRQINHLNVGTGRDISIKDLANLIANLTNFKGKIIWDKNKPDGTPKNFLIRLK